jgi:hypothetical protein
MKESESRAVIQNVVDELKAMRYQFEPPLGLNPPTVKGLYRSYCAALDREDYRNQYVLQAINFDFWVSPAQSPQPWEMDEIVNEFIRVFTSLNNTDPKWSYRFESAVFDFILGIAGDAPDEKRVVDLFETEGLLALRHRIPTLSLLDTFQLVACRDIRRVFGKEYAGLILSELERRNLYDRMQQKSCPEAVIATIHTAIDLKMLNMNQTERTSVFLFLLRHSVPELLDRLITVVPDMADAVTSGEKYHHSVFIPMIETRLFIDSCDFLNHGRPKDGKMKAEEQLEGFIYELLTVLGPAFIEQYVKCISTFTKPDVKMLPDWDKMVIMIADESDLPTSLADLSVGYMWLKPI